MSDPVLVERDGAVATIILNRPEVLNALNIEMALAFRAVVAEIALDDGIRCVVLRGAGRAFMAGGDVASFHKMLPDPVSHIATMIEDYHIAVRGLARMSKPVIAGLHGAVAGAGASLALTPDLAVAADNTIFTLAYTRIGTSPDGGSTYFLPRLVGKRRAMEIALLSDPIDAATALDLGLVNRVVPEADLIDETNALAVRLASGPTRAYAATRRLIDASFDNDLSAQLDVEREYFVACAASADFAEGVTAFVEKRAPEFKGK